MKIYFAGSIRGGRKDRKLYFKIIRLLQNYGEVLTEHIGNGALAAAGETRLDDRAIHDRDLAWLLEADVVIAEVTTPSLGVGYELGRAVEWNKKILCLYRLTDGRALSAMIAGSGAMQTAEYLTIPDLRKIFDDFFVADR